jgi:hypothetical protein
LSVDKTLFCYYKPLSPVCYEKIIKVFGGFFMKKGIYIDEYKSVEIVKFTKISEYVSGEKANLTDLLKIHSTTDAENTIIINDEEYGLPALIVPKSKMNDYDMESLLTLFEGAELDEGIEIADDYFFSEDEDEEEEEERDEFADDNSDWY